jgi:hypothetical protein
MPDVSVHDLWSGIFGLVGVIVGGVLQFWLEQRKTKAQRELDNKRKELLKTALENPPPNTEWRKLQTLSRVIGADYETTTRLLIELGARGSEGEDEVWALLSKKPLRGMQTQ